MNHIKEEVDSMAVISNKSENGNEDPKWVIEFMNLFIAITFVQWLSTLSRYLGDLEFVGWVLTASFAVIYIFLLILIREFLFTPSYIFISWGEQRNYTFCWFCGVILLLLFIPITSYCRSEVLYWQFMRVFVAVAFWGLVAGAIIPSLIGRELNKRRDVI